MIPRVEAALANLQTYLLDQIGPADAADSIALLMAQPPDAVMQQVGSWAVAQNRNGGGAIAELLLTAMKKLFVLGELDLLDREAVANFLDRVTTIALQLCPVDDRPALRTSLTQMRVSQNVSATLGLRAPAAAPIRPITLNTPLPSVDTEEAQAAKRFSMIVDRLSRQMSQAGSQGAAAEPQAVAQLLTMAAARSQNGQQLNEYLDQIGRLSGGKEGNVFVILGGALPSWDFQNLAPGSRPAPAQVDAMEKILELSDDPVVAMKRFRDLVSAAVTKFNDGSLGAALWMLDVAEDSITEKKLPADEVERCRAEAANAISLVQLKKYTESKHKLGALRIALQFFPALRLDVLLRDLRGEPRAEKRRALLAFIEAYGGAARDAAIEALEKELARPDVDTYYLRNAIFLLHRIPRDSEDGNERELEALSRASAPGQNIYVIKEAAAAIGHFRTEAAVKLLTLRLAELEAALVRGDTQYPVAEVHKLFDRITGSLLRIGTGGALLTVARHGMKANPLLGDTRARMAALGHHDLSFDEATVGIIVKALRDEIPGKLFGRLLPKKPEAALQLIEALSGTHTEETEELFADVAGRFGDQELGRAAAAILEKWSPSKPVAPSEPAPTLFGELEFFGLPAIMQSLAEMRGTGMLTLRTKQKQTVAKLVFSEGKFLNAQTDRLRGVEALYWVLECPVAGSFAFVAYPPDRMKTSIEPIEVMSVLLEGVRRHDELQRILVLVPDGTILQKTNVKPTPHEEETDATLVREVWMKATAGGPVGSWENQVPVDPYRVRRLVAHWVEQGALVAQ